MKDPGNNDGVIVNTEESKFEIELKGERPFVKYNEVDGVMHLTHVEVPFSLRNHGVGSGLMRSVMEHLRNADKKVKPVCPFAAAFIVQNPEFQDMVMNEPNLHRASTMSKK